MVYRNLKYGIWKKQIVYLEKIHRNITIYN